MKVDLAKWPRSLVTWLAFNHNSSVTRGGMLNSMGLNKEGRQFIEGSLASKS